MNILTPDLATSFENSSVKIIINKKVNKFLKGTTNKPSVLLVGCNDTSDVKSPISPVDLCESQANGIKLLMPSGEKNKPFYFRL